MLLLMAFKGVSHPPARAAEDIKRHFLPLNSPLLTNHQDEEQQLLLFMIEHVASAG